MDLIASRESFDDTSHLRTGCHLIEKTIARKITCYARETRCGPIGVFTEWPGTFTPYASLFVCSGQKSPPPAGSRRAPHTVRKAKYSAGSWRFPRCLKSTPRRPHKKFCQCRPSLKRRPARKLKSQSAHSPAKSSAGHWSYVRPE